MTIDTIITDLDDTLFNEKVKISDYTMGVMQECLRRGIRVIPASGRAQASMEPFVRSLNTGLPYIACNGAQLVNPDHTLLDSLTLDVDTTRDICRFFIDRNEYVQVYRDRMLYYAEECAESQLYKNHTIMEGQAVGDLMAFLTFETPKVLCVAAPERIAEMYPIARAQFAGRAILEVSKPFYLEATPLEADKGKAIERLAKHMTIVPERTFVFGDSLNDVSMYSFTENSVAMGNGREEAKKAARFVCGSNLEDGMARFVQEHILQ